VPPEALLVDPQDVLTSAPVVTGAFNPGTIAVVVVVVVVAAVLVAPLAPAELDDELLVPVLGAEPVGDVVLPAASALLDVGAVVVEPVGPVALALVEPTGPAGCVAGAVVPVALTGLVVTGVVEPVLAGVVAVVVGGRVSVVGMAGTGLAVVALTVVSVPVDPDAAPGPLAAEVAVVGFADAVAVAVLVTGVAAVVEPCTVVAVAVLAGPVEPVDPAAEPADVEVTGAVAVVVAVVVVELVDGAVAGVVLEGAEVVFVGLGLVLLVLTSAGPVEGAPARAVVLPEPPELPTEGLAIGRFAT